MELQVPLTLQPNVDTSGLKKVASTVSSAFSGANAPAFFDAAGLKTQLKSIVPELNKMKVAVQAVKSDFGGFQQEASKIKSAFESVKKSAVEVGAKLSSGLQKYNKDAFALKELGETISKIGESLGAFAERGAELVQSQKNLAAATGLTGKELAKLNDRAEEAFVHGIGENLADATRIIGKAQQQLGGLLDDTQLTAFTQGIGGIAKVFDEDLNETLGKTKTFLTAFDLKDGQKGADLFALAMQKGGNAANDILDTINEYSVLMKEAGFGAEEFVGTLTKGTELGAFNTDKLADAIKETQIRLKAGDIGTALAEIKSPITATIQGIVDAGAAGTLSVKEVLQTSAAEIERAFDAGEISDKLRSQLQVGISGTPAEELGSNLYGRLFSAPIDPSAIQEQGRQAGEQMAAALEPTFGAKLGKIFESLGDKAAAFSKPLADVAGGALEGLGKLGPSLSFLKDADLLPIDQIKKFKDSIGSLPGIAAKAGPALASIGTVATGPIGIALAAIVAIGAALTYYFTQTNEGKRAWADITEAVETFYDTAKPALDAIGNLITTYGKLIFTYVKIPFEIAWGIVKSLFTAVVNVVGSLSEVFGFSVKGDEMASSFDAIATAVDTVTQVLAGVIAGIESFKDSILEVFERLADFDIDGAIEAAKEAGPKIAQAFKKGAEEEARSQKIEIGQKSITAVAKVKVELAETEGLDKLKTDLSSATDEATRLQAELKIKLDKGDTKGVDDLKASLVLAEQKAVNLSQQMSEKLPGSIKGVRQVVLANGELATSYDIDIEKVGDLIDRQKGLYTKELQANQRGFQQGIQAQSEEYAGLRTKLQSVSEQISKATNPDEIAELTEQYKSLQEEIQVSGDVIEDTLVRGKIAGFDMVPAIASVAKGMNKSTAETTKLVSQERIAKQVAKDLVAEAGKLAEKFNAASQALQDAFSVDKAALASFNLRISKGEKLSEQDEAARQATVQRLKDTQGQLKQVNRVTAAIEKQFTLEVAEAEVGKTALQVAQEKYEAIKRAVELQRTGKELEQENAIIQQGRERNNLDDASIQATRLDLLNQQKNALVKILGLNDSQLSQVKELLATGADSTEALKALTFGIKFDKKTANEERKTATEEVVSILTEINASESVKNGIQLKLNLGDTELIQRIAELDQQTLEFKVSIGTATTEELISSLDDQAELIRKKIAALGEITTNEQLARQKEFDLELLQLLDKTAEIRYQKELDRINRVQEAEQAAAQKTADFRAQVFESINSTIFDTAQRLLDKSTAQAEARLQSFKDREIIGEEEFQAAVAAVQEDARRKQVFFEAQARSQKEAFDNEQRLRELEAINKTLLEKEALAKKEGRNADLIDIRKELALINEETAERGDQVKTTMLSLADSISGSLANIGQGDVDGLKDNLRSILGVLAGFIEKLASASITKVVLDWLNIDPTAAALPFLVKVAVLPGIQSLISSLVHGIIGPTLSDLASFPTGYRFDSPTTLYTQQGQGFTVGDGQRLGGRDTEWLLRDDQLRAIVNSSVGGYARVMQGMFGELIGAVDNIGGSFELRGEDLVKSGKRVTSRQRRRTVFSIRS